MATFPARNRLIGQHKATSFWTGTGSTEVPDIITPAGPPGSMSYSAGTTAHAAANGWSDSGRKPDIGTVLQMDTPAEAPIFDSGNAFMMKVTLLKTPFYTTGFSKRDILVLEPNAASGVDDQAFALTLVQEESTGLAWLSCQVYESGWYEYDSFPLPDLSLIRPTDLYVYVQHYNDTPPGDLSVELAIPAMDIKEAAYLSIAGAFLKFSEIGGSGLLATNRADIGAPPETGTDATMAFLWACALPKGIGRDWLFDLFKVDQLGYSEESFKVIWPADNSRAELGATLAAETSSTVTLSVSEASTFRAPGPNDIACVTVSDPADISVNEKMRLVGLDVLAGELTLSRGHDFFGSTPQEWPAGSILRAPLIARMNNPVASSSTRVDSENPSSFDLRQGVSVYKSDTLFLTGSDSWQLEIPDFGSMFLEEVWVVPNPSSSTDGATLEIEEPTFSDSIFSQVLPAVAAGDRWVSSTFVSTQARNKFKVSASGGTGSVAVYLKGTLS